MSDFILGAIVGILAAVLIVYWKQINDLYNNRGTISGVSQIVGGLDTLGVRI